MVTKRIMASAALIFAMQASAQTRLPGDAAHGLALYQAQCAACHSVDYNSVGPAHKGVFGRTAGTFPGYTYSSALVGSKIVWSAKTLDRWLTDPEALVPGQKMGYRVPDAGARADLIAYLKQISAAQ